MTKSPASPDPKKKFTGVKPQIGEVQQDSDWNNPPGKTRRSSSLGSRLVRLGWGGRILVLGFVAAVVVLATLLLVVFLPTAGTLNLNQTTLVSVSRPTDGSVVALHHQHIVVAEGFDADGVAELQLWINDQLWGAKPVSPARDRVTHTWAWIPSGEGEHHLVARVVDEDGGITESAVTRVYASPSIDVLLPREHIALTGDTVDSLALGMGTTAEAILDSNPQLSPSGSIPIGTPLTIPVPFPLPPSQTESGEPAAPPVANAELPLGSKPEDIVQAYQGGNIPMASSFSLIDGVLTPNDPVELLYLYLSVNGKEWGRLPQDPDKYLTPEGKSFDLTAYLKAIAQKVGTDPVQMQAEVWAWRGGELTFLGTYVGDITTDGGGLQTTATGTSQVRLIDYTYLGKEHYKKAGALTGDDPDMTESFRWTTTIPGVTYAIWQVSDGGFPPGAVLNPPGLVHHGVSKGNGGKFTLNFDNYIGVGSGGSGGSGGFGGLGGFDFPNSPDDLLGLTQDPEKSFPSWLPRVFFIRIVPMTGAPGLTQQVAGPPSPPVPVLYIPSGAPYTPKSPPNGPVYEARVVGWNPYRPADPEYATCTVTNYEVRDCRNIFGYGYENSKWSSVGTGAVENGQLTLAQYQQCKVVSPKGLLACGCPGVSCSSSGGSSCGEFSLEGLSDCAGDLGEGLASALSSAASFGASLYNGAVDFVTDTLSSVACGGLSGDAKKACEVGVKIAVNAGLASLGLPPEIPDFQKFMNEGLDYALAVAAEELTASLGFECDKFCQDLIKAGIEGIQDPEALMDDGLAFAASHAADELKDLGVECDAKCQGLIQQAAQGDLQASVAFNIALDKAAAEAATLLNNNGYPCNAACQTKIRDSMEDARDLVNSAQDTAAAKPPAPPLLPHPLAVAQPAVVTVEIFRRWESAGIPQEDLNHCGLTVFTSETSPLAGTQYTFAPFMGVGLELPLIDPGETIRIPISLDRKFTDITPAMVQAALADLKNKGVVVAGAVTSDGKPLEPMTESGPVSGGILTAWFNLYHGGSLQVKLSGPPFFTSAAGGGTALPCVADETWVTGVGEP